MTIILDSGFGFMKNSIRKIISKMFYLAIISLAFCFINPCIASAATLVDESFETTGYDPENTWTETVSSGNTLDEDYPMEEDSHGYMPPGSATETLHTVSGSGFNAYTDYNFGADKSDISLRIYFKIDSSSLTTGANSNIANILNSSDTGVVRLRLSDSGGTEYIGFQCYNNGAFTTELLDTFSTDVWYMAEYRYKTTSTASYQYKLTRLYDSATIRDTGSQSLTGTLRTPRKVRLGLLHSVQTDSAETHTDLLRVDDAGTALLGGESDFSSTDITTFRPNAAGDSISGVDPTMQYPSSGSRYDKVDEESPDDESTYVYGVCSDGNCSNDSSAEGDLYNIQDPSGTLKKILGVRVWLRSKEHVDQPGMSEIKVQIKTHETEYSPHASGESELYREPIYVGDTYKDFFYEWESNPNTGKPWTWDEIEQLQIGSRVPINRQAEITQVWMEVIQGASNYRYATDSPIFGGTTVSQTKVFARSARPSYVGNKNSYLKVRYKADSDCSTVNMGSGYSETSSREVTSSTDWTHIFTISSLSTYQKYCFDVYSSPDGSNDWLSTHDTFNMSYYPEAKTFPTEGQDADVDIGFADDSHGPNNHQVINSLASKNPDFLIVNGDIHTNIGATTAADTLANGRQALREMWGGPNWTFVDNLLRKMPIFDIWDDHDYYDNNTDKTAANKAQSKQAFLEYIPHPDFPTENANGQHGIWTKFKVANAEIFILDGRYRRDPSRNPTGNYGADMLDGTRTDSTGADPTPKMSGTANGYVQNQLYESAGGFNDNVHVGDLVHNTSDSTYASIKTKIDDTHIELWNPATGALVDTFNNGNENYKIYESGASDHNSKLANETAGHIQREWLIDAVNSSTAKWKIIISPVVFNPDELQENENWADYDPEEFQRQYLVDNIAVENVIINSANKHAAGIDDGTNSDFPELLCGPLGITLHNLVGTWSEFSQDAQTPGGNVFGMMKIRSNYVTLECYDNEGTLLGSLQVDNQEIVSITLDTDGTVDYGITPLDSEKDTTLVDTQTAENDGNVAEDFNIKTSHATGGTQWSAGGTAGNNTYVHSFSTNDGASWDPLQTYDEYEELASNISPDGTKNFDLKIHTPTIIADHEPKTITVTIQAVRHQ